MISSDGIPHHNSGLYELRPTSILTFSVSTDALVAHIKGPQVKGTSSTQKILIACTGVHQNQHLEKLVRAELWPFDAIRAAPLRTALGPSRKTFPRWHQPAFS